MSNKINHELTLAKLNRYPDMEEVEFIGIGGYMKIMPGAYLVTFNEEVSIKAVTISKPVALLAHQGATVDTMVLEPGYSGIP